MNDALMEAFTRLPDYLGGHMRLSLASIAAALAVALPLGVYSASRPALAGPALTVASVTQTIPALALLALMVPLLGGMIGFLPAFIALALYGVLPVLRNTIVGLQGVDETVREAARGVGMTPVQSLVRVELPLALPTIVAGLRTATVWVVGAATLATPVGATSLGNYIFAGLQTRSWTTVVFGCIASAGLALVLDQLIRLLERSAARRRAGLGAIAGGAIAALVLVSLVPAMFPRLMTGGEAGTAEAAAEAGFGSDPVVIGSKAFTEQYILAEAMGALLSEAGARTRRLENLGSTVAFNALASGEVDVYVDYSGTLWDTILQGEGTPPGRYEMFAAVSSHLYERYGIITLGRLGFENAYGFAVTRARAEGEDLETLGDLAELESLAVGADPEFFVRPEWTRVRAVYGLSGAQERAMDATFMYSAVRDGEVDAVTAYTTDGRIDAFDLVVLDDPAGVLPPYDALILISPEAADSRAIARALSPLIGAIDAPLMREANALVDLERRGVPEAAQMILEAVRDD